MNNPIGARPSDRPTLNFGLEIQESCDFEISAFRIPWSRTTIIALTPSALSL